ncbi:MAG: YjfB family protein [Oscillospiraceae bacterium]
MDLSNSIAQMSMNMSAAQLQQGVNTAMMKKAMESSTDMIKGVLEMADAIPKFPGANGSILDVRA